MSSTRHKLFSLVVSSRVFMLRKDLRGARAVQMVVRARPLNWALNVDGVESADSEREGLEPKDRRQLLTIIPILQS